MPLIRHVCAWCSGVVEDDMTIVARDDATFHARCYDRYRHAKRHARTDLLPLLGQPIMNEADKATDFGPRHMMDHPRTRAEENAAHFGAAGAELNKLPPLPAKISDPIQAADDPRHKQHGTFQLRSAIAQEIKQTLRFGKERWACLDSDQRQALDEIAGKISRICCGDPNDPEHWDDIAGYAKLVADRLKGVVR